MRRYLSIFLFLSLVTAGHAREITLCRVDDPTGSPLNVRAAPNDFVLGTVPNGTWLEAVDHQTFRGKRWTQVVLSDATFGTPKRLMGWVFGGYLACETAVIDYDGEQAALFTSWTALDYEDDTPVLTAIACRKQWEWSADRQSCMRALPAIFDIAFLDKPAQQLNRPDMYGQEAVGVEKGVIAGDFFVYPASAPQLLASKCYHSVDKKSEKYFLEEPPSISGALQKSLNEQERALLESAVANGRFEVSGNRLEGDFDSNNELDSLAGASLPKPKGTDGMFSDLHFAIVTWANGKSEVIAFNAHYMPYFPQESRCFDLDEDGVAEILLAEGGETERHYRYIELSEGQFEDVGFGAAGGD